MSLAGCYHAHVFKAIVQRNDCCLHRSSKLFYYWRADQQAPTVVLDVKSPHFLVVTTPISSLVPPPLPTFFAKTQSSAYWGRDNDGIAADAKLGYQVPRLWFPHSKPGQAGVHLEERAPATAGVAMPEPRPRASGGADLPIGSDGVVQEYQQMQAFRAYR